MKIYTRAGDEGQTGLLHGEKVAKDSVLPEAYGTVDEAQAILGLVRTECGDNADLESEYVEVFFELKPGHKTEYTDGDIYLIGGFTNWEIIPK